MSFRRVAYKCLQKTELIYTIQPSILVDRFNNIFSLVNKRIEDIVQDVEYLWCDIRYVFAELFTTFSLATEVASFREVS
jgi:hypothetical protein